jgi:hypothetical protein
MENNNHVAPKPYQFLAWCATASLIASSIMASLNLYPYYNWGFMWSNLLWIAVGILWREKSLIVMNTTLTAIYIVGLAFTYFK